MEIGLLLILLALILSCAADLSRPFQASRRSSNEAGQEILQLQQDIQAVRRQFEELLENFAAHKVDPDFFTTQQNRLLSDMQQRQRELEQILENDPIELAVEAERARIQESGKQTGLSFTCAFCGEPIQAGHRFCPSCGNPRNLEAQG